MPNELEFINQINSVKKSKLKNVKIKQINFLKKKKKIMKIKLLTKEH